MRLDGVRIKSHLAATLLWRIVGRWETLCCFSDISQINSSRLSRKASNGHSLKVIIRILLRLGHLSPGPEKATLANATILWGTPRNSEEAAKRSVGYRFLLEIDLNYGNYSLAPWLLEYRITLLFFQSKSSRMFLSVTTVWHISDKGLGRDSLILCLTCAFPSPSLSGVTEAITTSE